MADVEAVADRPRGIAILWRGRDAGYRVKGRVFLDHPHVIGKGARGRAALPGVLLNAKRILHRDGEAAAGREVDGNRGDRALRALRVGRDVVEGARTAAGRSGDEGTVGVERSAVGSAGQ